MPIGVGLMKTIFALLTITFLASGVVNAAEEFLGFWASSPKEVLNITKDGDAYHALFTRENVKNEFEKVGFPAAIEDGALVITGEQGGVTAEYDEGRKVLILGGLKTFQRISAEQAASFVSQIEKK